MDASWLLLTTLYGTVGLGMFIYGKKQVRFVALIAGLALMIVPYFIDSLLLMTFVSVVLMGSPFFIDA